MTVGARAKLTPFADRAHAAAGPQPRHDPPTPLPTPEHPRSSEIVMTPAFPVSASALIRRHAALLASTGLFLAMGLTPDTAWAGGPLPAGGSVVSGNATISTTGSAVTVTQTTARGIVDWQSFSVGQGNTVTFVQPTAQSATLNRVTGSAGSQIAGLITANGVVYLINPNGIAITRTGAVQTGGGFVASTLDISNADFNAGRLNFAGHGASAAVSNAGTISAGQGGYVALLGGTVGNAGLISVPLGQVGLGSGEAIALDINGGHFMQVAIATDAAGTTGSALIDMSGSITAAGGRITLSAASLRNAVRNVINLSGTINVDSATGTAGSIQLLGGDGGTVNVGGSLSARATGATGDGGSIETSGAAVNFAGLKIDTSAAHGLTGQWLVDPNDLTVDAAAASTLNAALKTSNVTLSTDGYGVTSGPGVISSGAGDININSVLFWTSTNTLSLSAYHDIVINAAINARTGGLTLAANNSGYQGGSTITAFANVNVGTFTLNTGDWVQDAAVLPSFSAKYFSFNPQNASFLRAAGGDGSSTNPYLLTDVYGLQGLRSYRLLADDFALSANIDASGTALWNGGAGFAPIGDNAAFTGNLDGKGHTISRLTMVYAGGNAGLFAHDAGNISNLTLYGGSISATNGSTGALVGYQDAGSTITNVTSSAMVSGLNNVGGLVGDANGAIIGGHTSGAVTANGSTAGGLVGFQGAASTISTSTATGTVTDTAVGNSDIGGLVGFSAGTIDRSYASGKVTGGNSVGGLVGGLCSHVNGCSGDNAPIAAITNSYATGAVSGSNSAVGGLVGEVYTGNITNSYATGTVTAIGESYYTGGLVGQSLGYDTFSQVHATGAVTGQAGVGGLVGNAGGNGSTVISNAYATGNVKAGQQESASGSFGGLVGDLGSSSSVTQAYATGSVTNPYGDNAYGRAIGGLVGLANGSVTFSHATGAVSGTNDYVGGLIGRDNNQTGVADTNNYATGNVIGNTLPDAYFNGATIGGLIGAIDANETIANSYATGNVYAPSHVGGTDAGGLIGYIGNAVVNVTKSYATGNVRVTGAVSTVDGYGNLANTVSNKVGGLIGQIGDGHGVIDQVYASGAVLSDGQRSDTGGLVGEFQDGGNHGVISNAYATGTVTAMGHYATRGTNTQASDAGGGGYQQNTGGFIGRLDSGAIINSYATGKVLGFDDIGGFSGYTTTSGVITASFWNTQTAGAGVDNLQGGKGLTTAQLQDPATYATTYNGWNFTSVWAPPSAGYYPQLFALTPVIYATANSVTSTYGRAPTGLGTFTGGPASYVFGPAGDKLTGFVPVSTTGSASSNVGSYAITPYAGGTFTSADGVVYRVIAGSAGMLTINPATLQVVYTADPLSLTMGSAIPGLTGTVVIRGLVNGDTGTSVLTGSALFNTTATSASKIGSYAILGSGLALGSQNYTVQFVQASTNWSALKITK